MDKDKLREILRKHKQWLDNVPGGKRANLQYADLRGVNLHAANLQHADLRDADLQYADLRGAELRDADLQYADLRGAELRDADLRGANLDFSCWPLWCGSLDVKVDASIARQLAYHFCRLDCDDPEYQVAREAIKDFANKFHRIKECGEITGEKTKEVGKHAR